MQRLGNKQINDIVQWIHQNEESPDRKEVESCI